MKKISFEKKIESKAFPIVGMSAPVGGLGAFGQFSRNMPADRGMGFVLVPHPVSGIGIQYPGTNP
jgi:chemotaxis response regulator CheB